MFLCGQDELEILETSISPYSLYEKIQPQPPLGRHVLAIHSGIFLKIYFLILDRVHPGLHGSDWNKILLQQEQKWIFSLQATRPPALNDAISFQPFLKGFASGGSEWDANEVNPSHFLLIKLQY